MQKAESLSDTRLLLDTYCTIIIHGDVDSELLDEAFALCAELEALFSITIEGSDVWRINHAGGEPVRVDSRTIEVVKAGLEFSRLSDGAFDIAIGRVTRLWDFSMQVIPDDTDISAALSAGSIRDVRVSENTVWIPEPDGSEIAAWLDLGAIAKGFIADEIAAFLTLRGVSGAMIDLGGDVATVGNRYDGNPWRIALRKPYGAMDEWVGVAQASGVAIVSSGIYERQFEKDGVIYHHILDSLTGMPVQTDVVSAVIISESATVGEGLSTIAVLVGSERAAEYFEKVSGFIGAVLILESGEMLKFGDVDFIHPINER